MRCVFMSVSIRFNFNHGIYQREAEKRSSTS